MFALAGITATFILSLIICGVIMAATKAKPVVFRTAAGSVTQDVLTVSYDGDSVGYSTTYTTLTEADAAYTARCAELVEETELAAL